MYEIFITEKKYINLEDSSVGVSFQLPGHDWSELSQSPQWKAVENFLSQKKSTDNQTNHTAQEDYTKKPAKHKKGKATT